MGPWGPSRGRGMGALHLLPGDIQYSVLISETLLPDPYLGKR